MNLQTIINEIELNTPNSLLDPRVGPEATAGGRRGLRTAALERLKQLRIEYRKELAASSVFIIVTGQNRQAFCDTAAVNPFDCFVADSEAFYKDIVSRIDPRLFGNERISHLFSIMANCLEDKAMELDLGSYNPLLYRDEYSAMVTSPEELVLVLKRAINDQVGSEIVGIDAVASIVDTAIARKHSAYPTPIVLNTPDETLSVVLNKDLKRLTPNVFLVSAGKPSKFLKTAGNLVAAKDASSESVGNALSSIRSNLR